jgi:hypothetical protein
VSPSFSLEAKGCEKFRGSEIAKKRVCFACFRKIAKSSFSSKNGVQNEAKRREKRPKEVKKRGNLIEKQKVHEKIGQP